MTLNICYATDILTIRFIRHAVVYIALLTILAGPAAAGDTIHVDCARPSGTIRPLHGVNGGPLVQAETTDLSRQWREIGVPITRLHDCEWPLPDVVDVHAIFPRPEADPKDPASYQFQLTDAYVKAIIDSGSQIVYRLGESIEHSQHKQFVHPPRDTQQWADTCLGIVRHYNDSWANGAHYNIRYWEIWNEPENRPSMWSGSDEDYYRLYATTAKTLKAAYPDLLLGGPAVGATGELDGDTLQPTPFLTGFLNHVGHTNAPLDFFSWHTYTNDPYLYLRKARAIRKWLDDHGQSHTKIHLNEWNYLPQNDWGPMLQRDHEQKREDWFNTIGASEGAAFTACVLAYLQDSPIDVANYYSGEANAFGLFSRYGVPHKTFYAMKAFHQLLDTPNRVHISGWEPSQTAACAGVNEQHDRVQVLLSNLRATTSEFTLQIAHLPWNAPTQWRLLCVDEHHNLQQIAAGITAAGDTELLCAAPAPSVVLVQLQPAPDALPSTVTENTPPAPDLAGPAPTTTDRLQLLSLRDVHITSPFWSPKLDVYRQQTIPHSWQYMGWELRSLKHAVGEPVTGDLNGTWGEANLYKFLETCAYSLAQFPDPELTRQVDEVIQLLGRAQQPDGYLHVYVTNNQKQPWDPEFLDGSHDAYVLGHMIEAAIEYHAATGKDAFLQIAQRAADQACRHFLGPEGKPGFGGHAELEMAMAELYRVTGESRYLDLVQAFVERRGHRQVKPFSETPRAYFQDAAPLRQQKTLEGHAVRAIFFATGVADLALEEETLGTSSQDYRLAANRFWDSTARRRMTITGSIGPRQEHEAIGEDYELPLDGYYESCAACGLADFAHRMFLLERRSEFVDVLERVLYNAVLHGISLDGTSSYYQNPLSDRDHLRDNCWVCCPPNLSRTLLQIGRYALAYNDSNLYVNLFVAGSYTLPLTDGPVQVEMQTDYPWGGKIRIELAMDAPRELTLRLRLPDWCREATLTYAEQPATTAVAGEDGYVSIQRRWAPGDQVELNLAMPATWMEAHPNIRSCEGRVALQRGPLIYALEGLDNQGTVDFTIDPRRPVTFEQRNDLLGGIGVLSTQAADGRPLLAIPFYTLANRDKSCQEVWRPQQGAVHNPAWWSGELYRPVGKMTNDQ